MRLDNVENSKGANLMTEEKKSSECSGDRK